jgi:hypothetical protein
VRGDWRKLHDEELQNFNIAVFLDLIHRSVIKNKTTMFWELTLLLSSGESTSSVGSDIKGYSQST